MWIHENNNWPDFSWENEKVLPVLVRVRHLQGRLLGRMEGLGFSLKQEASLNTLTRDVVTSSAIEGEKLSAEEVRSSIARRLGIEIAGLLIPASRDVEGIVEIMLDATQKHEKLTDERLFGWHSALFPAGRSGMHRIIVGAWRTEATGAMQVVSGAVGRETVHFEAPQATRLEKEMTAFLHWFEDESPIDPVIKAGIAHFWFITIHPFEDGNGRIARAIADMALSRADGICERFYSMSAQIEKERKIYYSELEKQQRNSTDITDWLIWFLECLERAIDSARETTGNVIEKAKFWEHFQNVSLNERQRKMVNRLLDGFQGNINTSRYARMTKCSNDTALRDLRALLNLGILIKNAGAGRSTSYSLIAIEDLL